MGSTGGQANSPIDSPPFGYGLRGDLSFCCVDILGVAERLVCCCFSR
jgi:hypothetical protein